MRIVPKDLAQTRMTLDELRAEDEAVKERIRSIDAEHANVALSTEARDEMAELRDYRKVLAEHIEEREVRITLIQALDNEQHVERSENISRPATATRARTPEDVYDLGWYRMNSQSDEHYTQQLRDGAMRAIERAVYPHPDADKPKIQAHLERLQRTIDQPEAFSRHILQTGSPLYHRAFAKAWAQQPLTGEEQRSIALSPGTAGGVMAPFDLDPTVILTSDGVINPLRNGMARVEQVIGQKWQGVTSQGVVASRKLEKQVTEGQVPVFAQPEVSPVRVDTLVPYTFEASASIGSLQTQIARMIVSAKDEEEADSFINGDGVEEEPGGLITTLEAGSVINSGVSNDFSALNIYAVKNQTPPRFRGRGQYLAEGAIYDFIRQLDDAGGSNLWVQLADPNPATLAGRPAREISTMSGEVANGEQVLIYGDFSQFLIVDQIGMAFELIPHLFNQQSAGSGFGRPTGQRGVYAYWMNNSKILVHEAFRLLEIGSS